MFILSSKNRPALQETDNIIFYDSSVNSLSIHPHKKSKKLKQILNQNSTKSVFDVLTRLESCFAILFLPLLQSPDLKLQKEGHPTLRMNYAKETSNQ